MIDYVQEATTLQFLDSIKISCASCHMHKGSYSHSAIAAVIPIPVVVLTSGIELAAATQSSVCV